MSNMDQGYQVTTIAGNGKSGFKDGNATEATFHGPYGICISNDGRIYVADTCNHIIRMVYNEQVTTIAGNGLHDFRDGNAIEAMFYNPMAVCVSKDEIIYVSDTYNNRIRMIHDGKVTTIAGNGEIGFRDGNAIEAMFNHPRGIYCSKNGRLYVADSRNNRIRMIYNEQVTTIAGSGERGFKDGNALEAVFRNPNAICLSKDRKMYIADTHNYRIRVLYNNEVTTIAGKGENAPEEKFSYPDAICTSTDGRLYVTDTYSNRIRMIYKNEVTTIAGNSLEGFQDGNALEAMFHHPEAICMKDGKLYVADFRNNRIRMICNDEWPIEHQNVPFGFALLLDMQNTFCDCQISFNNVIYHLHSTLINVRCPLLLDQSYFSLLQQSNISNESFDSFVTFLYSNKFTKEQNQTWQRSMSIKIIIELIFFFDLLMNCKSILQQLKTRFTKQLIETVEINQKASMRKLIADLLPFIYNLKQLIKTRPIKSNLITTNTSYTEYCYNLIVHELQQRRSTVEQHLTELEKNMTYIESYKSIFTQLMSEQGEIDTTALDDESMINFGFALTELSKLAFEQTNISHIDDNNNNTISESITISTQHLDAWTRPDFVIKLSNDDDNISYHVHKIVLCGRWKYFCQMIESGMKESKDNEMTLSDDWNKSRFEKMMKYIYLNEIDFESLSDVEWLMENGKLYGMIVDIPKNQGKNDHDGALTKDQIDQVGAYGFEELYDHCNDMLDN